MLVSSRVIVLNSFKYKDDSFIAHVLTEKEGYASFLVRISRSPRATVRHTLFQPLALLQLEWEEKKTLELIRPKSAQVAVPFISLLFHPVKATMALFLSEFLSHALRSEPMSPALFEYVYRSVEWLDTAQKDFANFHLVFLMRLSRFLGFFPDLTLAGKQDYFDMEKCTFTPHRPVHPYYLEPVDAARLPVLLRMRYENMRFFRFSGVERNRFLHHLNIFYRLHLPNFPELRSLSVLREVFEVS